MKLSKAQQNVIDTAHREIEFARNHTLREYVMEKLFQVTNIEDVIVFKNHEMYNLTKEQAIKHINDKIDSQIESYKKYYEQEKQGVVLTMCSGATLKKLENLGLIEVIYNSTNTGSYSIDTVKILNF